VAVVVDAVLGVVIGKVVVVADNDSFLKLFLQSIKPSMQVTSSTVLKLFPII
jgi:hypothetical protein